MGSFNLQRSSFTGIWRLWVGEPTLSDAFVVRRTVVCSHNTTESLSMSSATRAVLSAATQSGRGTVGRGRKQQGEGQCAGAGSRRKGVPGPRL